LGKVLNESNSTILEGGRHLTFNAVNVTNKTNLPYRAYADVLNSTLAALLALEKWPKTDLKNVCVGIRSGKTQEIMTPVYVDPDGCLGGFYVEMRWAINPRDRNSFSAECKDFTDNVPDIMNALDVYNCCVHELGHCLDFWNDLLIENAPSSKLSKKRYREACECSVHEIRAREYERRVLCDLKDDQWKVIKALAGAITVAGDPRAKKSSYRFPTSSGNFLWNRVRKYWYADEAIEEVQDE